MIAFSTQNPLRFQMNFWISAPKKKKKQKQNQKQNKTNKNLESKQMERARITHTGELNSTD